MSNDDRANWSLFPLYLRRQVDSLLHLCFRMSKFAALLGCTCIAALQPQVANACLRVVAVCCRLARSTSVARRSCDIADIAGAIIVGAALVQN